jgi:PAP2 superfamily protein
MKNTPRWARIAVSILVVIAILGFALDRSVYTVAIASEFFSLALVSALIFQVRAQKRMYEGLWVLTGALILLAASALRGFPLNRPVVFSMVGLAALGVLALRTVWAEASLRRELLWLLLPALLFDASEWYADDLLRLTRALHPKVLDLYLYSFDGSLGFQPSFGVGRWFLHSHLLAAFSDWIYVGLPIGIAVAYAGQVGNPRGRPMSALLALLATGPVGVVFYNIFPALGPIHIVTRDFPYHPLTAAQMHRLFLEPVMVEGPRNAIPSLHMAWALLVLWHCRVERLAARAFAWVFLVFTILGTMGTGEHYFVDLVVAFPFALAVFSATLLEAPWMQRAATSLVGFGATLLWLVLLRQQPHWFWISPVVSWGAVALSTFASLAGYLWLQQRSQAATGQEYPTLERVAVPAES